MSNHDLELRLDQNNHLEPYGGRNNRTTLPVDTIHNNRLMINNQDSSLYGSILPTMDNNLSRSSSASTLKPDAPDHPSLSDLGSIADLSANFKSLTARKLMAGLSISSIDTLLEVNTAHDNHHKLSILNESTETIDFGVI